jgi:ribosomal protein S18 acetylase RimI-like enzyme
MSSTGARPAAVRRASAADAAALTALRALMLTDMGMLAAGGDSRWRDRAGEWFAERLGDRAGFAAFVIDDPEAGVVSCAVGLCERHAPGPANPDGVQGHVFNMSTDHRFRRLGYARACLEALLAWFQAETKARVITLNATPDGIALYTALGFTAPSNTFLQLKTGSRAPENGG